MIPVNYNPAGFSVHGVSSKDTGVGCHFLLQGIFPTQGSNQRLSSPALAGRFFITSTTWEAPLLPPHDEHIYGHCPLFQWQGCEEWTHLCLEKRGDESLAIKSYPIQIVMKKRK